jgi:predicted Zn-dependent protease
MALTKRYDRSQEDQADRAGLRYAHEAGYDVSKGPGLWDKFARKYGQLPRAVNFFVGSHSRSTDRAARLEQQIRLNYSPSHSH